MVRLKKYLALLLAGLIAALSLPITALAEDSVPEVAGITFEEISIIEGTEGSEVWSVDPETQIEYKLFYHYHYTPKYTVTLKGGTVLESEFGRITYNGEDYWLSYFDPQSYENQWEVGTHKVECEILGFKSSFDVTITQSPFQKLDVEDVVIIEGTHGYKRTDWDEETNSQTPEYYYYYDVTPEFTVTLKDGTVLESENKRITYNGEEYYLSYQEEQSYKNPWGLGTRTVDCEIMGVKSSYNVTITETPVKELKAENVSIVEGTHGFYDMYWDGEKTCEYYCYNITPKCTVTLKDGTVLELKDGWITYNGELYGITCYDSQSYENQWGIGTYTAECEIMGVKAEYEVEIIEDPYVSIDIIEVKPLEEGIDCWTDYDGKIIYHSPEVIFKLTDRDGKTTELSTRDDDDAYFEYNQRENPWTIGGENSFTLHYANLSAEGSAIIKKPADYAYVEAEDGSGVFISDCRISGQENLELPSQIDGKTVIGIISLGWNENLSEVKSVTIPDSVKTIIRMAFSGCENLTEIKVGSGNKYLSSENGVLFNKDKTELVAYPAGKTGEYAIPNGVTSIVYNSFYNCKNLNSVKIPSSVTEIQEWAFTNCTSLTSVTIPHSVKTIGENAFGYTWENEDGKVPNFTINGYSGSVAEEYANEHGFKFISFPKESLVNENGVWYYTVDGEKKNATTLVEYYGAWYYVEKGKVNFEATTLCMYEGAWYYVEKGKVNFEATTLCEYAGAWYYIRNGKVDFTATTLCFYEGKWYYVEQGRINFNATAIGHINVPDNLINVTIPDGFTSIEENAFSECSELTSLNIPDTVTSIGDWAFYNCGKLSSINIPDGVDKIGYMTFYGCSSLTEISLPETLKSIDYNAFSCSGLTSLVIPKGVITIGDCAFSECTNLTSITIPASVTHIGDYAFYNCTNLTIKCFKNSAAYNYAAANNIPYVLMMDSVPAPNAPIAATKTHNSVTLVPTAGYQYKMDDGKWQDSNVFSGLKPNEKHTFYQRVKETETAYASESSLGKEVTTDKMTVAAPSEPTVVTKTYNSVTLTANSSYEYKMDNGKWQDSNVFSGLKPNEKHTFYQRVKETDTVYVSKQSKGTEVTTPKKPANKPIAPVLEAKTHKSVTLKKVAGYEYSMDGKTWLSSNVFNNLKPETEYTFYQRIAETNTTDASIISVVLKVKTNQLPPKEGLVNENGVWYYAQYGEKVNATTLVKHDNTWYYVENGKVNFKATTLFKYGGAWYYVEKGKVNFNATTLCNYGGAWYYVEKGKANFNVTTLCNYGGVWYYVEKGKVNFNATTLCKYGNTWYYVEKGKVNFNATTLCNYGGMWYYIEKGKVNFNGTTLCKYGNTWYYVQGGKVNFNATTLCKYGNTWYYVEKGKVNFKANLRFKYYGKFYNVRNGVVKF